MKIVVIGFLVSVFAAGLSVIPATYFAAAGHGLIARFKGDEDKSEEGRAFMFDLGYLFTALLALGFAATAEKTGLGFTFDNSPTTAVMMFTFLGICIALATPIVMTGAKLATRLFHRNVRFAHWWSTRVVTIGPRRPTFWWAWM